MCVSLEHCPPNYSFTMEVQRDKDTLPLSNSAKKRKNNNVMVGWHTLFTSALSTTLKTEEQHKLYHLTKVYQHQP